MKTALALMTMALVAATLVAQTGGHISGVVTDASGAVLPGVTVTATAAGRAVTAVTDRTGHYELRDVPAGLCRLTASLPGFRVGVQELRLATAAQQNADFTMRVGCLSQYVFVDSGLQAVYAGALAVAVLSTHGSTPRASVTDAGCPCLEQTFFVDRVFKGPSGLTGTLVSVQFDTDRPPSSEQLVGFLQRPTDSAHYTLTGWHYRLPVSDGRGVVPEEFGRDGGLPASTMTLDQLEEFLHKLPPPRPPGVVGIPPMPRQ